MTIIVPVYKSKEFIARCVHSIQEQTFANFECILVDDCDPDNSIGSLSSAICADTRFRVIRHRRNSGPGMCRNTGIESTRTQFLSFVDSDDYIEKNYVEQLYTAMSTENADIVSCNYYAWTPKLSTVKRNSTANSPITWNRAIYRILAGEDNGEVWGRMYKTSLFQNIRFPRGIHEDTSTLIRVLKKNEVSKFMYADTYLYNYVKHGSNITTSVSIQGIDDFVCNGVGRVLSELYNEKYKNQKYFYRIPLQVYIAQRSLWLSRVIIRTNHNVWEKLFYLRAALIQTVSPELIRSINGNILPRQGKFSALKKFSQLLYYMFLLRFGMLGIVVLRMLMIKEIFKKSEYL